MKYIVSFSGGKDSTATLLWAINNYYLKDIIVCFCDTGWETPVTYEYVKYIEDYCKNIGVSFFRLKNDLLFEELILKTKIFPTFRRRFCTQYLKVAPQIKFFKNLKEDFICLTGERREESRARRDLLSKDYTTKDGFDFWIHRPILDWTEQQVFDYIRQHNIKINPMYSLGFSRVGCAPCIFARLKEIYLIHKHFPEQIEKIRNLEYRLKNTKTFFYRNGKIFIDQMVEKVVKKYS